MRPLRPRLVLLVLIAGCAPAPASRATAEDQLQQGTFREHDFLDAGVSNHLLPVKVAVDPAHRRAWSLSASVGSVAEVDLDTSALVAVHALPEGISFDHPQIAADGDGTVWIGHDGDPWLLRLSGGEVTTWTGDGHVRAVLGRPVGGVALAGTWDDRSGVRLLDRQGEEQAFGPVDGIIGSLAWTHGDLATMVASGDDQELVLLDSSDLSEQDRVPTPLYATGMAGLDDGSVVAASTRTVTVIASDGTASDAVPAGNEITTVVDLGGGEFLLLDRNGGRDPTSLEGNFWGVARRFDESLTETADPLPTGFNSGFGGLDPVTGELWVNSEGTTELWSIDPDSGEVATKVTVGTHVELATADPSEPDLAWYTGRLSGTIGRVDLASGEALSRDDVVRWPVCPVMLDGVMWVLDEITAVMVGLDPDTLEVLATWDTGQGENPTLVFNQLIADPDRGTLLLTHAWNNVLVEIDPATGEQLGLWHLAGAALDTMDNPGRLEVALVGDRVVTHRVVDGALTLVDLDEPQPLAGAHVSLDLIGELDGNSRLQRLSSDPGDRQFYVGGHAFDRDTLLPDAEGDLPVDYLVGQAKDGGWLGLTADGLALLDANGEVTEVLDLGLADPAHAVFDRVGDRVVFTDYLHARLGVAEISAFEGL